MDTVLAPVTEPLTADHAESALAELVAGLHGGEPREGQRLMARAVMEAMTTGTHQLVDAPPGVGKSFGYLVPAALAAEAMRSSDERSPIVVATATKALQEQVLRDIPLLQKQFPNLTASVLKGRSNYVCRSRVASAHSAAAADEPLFTEPVDPYDWERLDAWISETRSGDRSDAPSGITDAAWRAVSVGPRECHGEKCAFADTCFANQARSDAMASDIIVTNVHLLLLDAATGGGRILPEYDILIVDEAHKLEEIGGNVYGTTLRPRRFEWLANLAGSLIDEDSPARVGMLTTAEDLEAVLADAADGGRIEPGKGAIGDALTRAQAQLASFRSALNAADVSEPDKEQRREQVRTATAGLMEELVSLIDAGADDVVWIESNNGRNTLRLAPVDLSDQFAETLFENHTAIMCSATLAVGGTFDHVKEQLGLPQRSTRELLVPSPFDYPSRTMLYVPKHITDKKAPNTDGWDEEAKRLTLKFLQAAGGRALLLFTSWTRLRDTCEWLEAQGQPWNLLRQGDEPPRRLAEQFLADETSVLAATQSFWEGIDLPGKAGSLVIIDKLPFPHFKDPLIKAKTERAESMGRNGFVAVSLPRASVLLTQGVGRLMRRVDDSGVVVVLDPRLANKDPWYRNVFLDSLPPMRRTIDEDAVCDFLRECVDG